MVPEISLFSCPCFSTLISYQHLQQCLCLLCQLQHLLHLNLSFVKPPSMCQLPHMTGMHLIRCVFRLSKCQLDTWFWLCKIKAEEHLDYLLFILGKEGYAAMDHWVPTDETHKQDLERFLNYLESTLDDEISPQVHI